MTRERYRELFNDIEAKLTPEEVKEGWHFCTEMDGLVANYNEPDGDCFCSLNTKRVYEKVVVLDEETLIPKEPTPPSPDL